MTNSDKPIDKAVKAFKKHADLKKQKYLFIMINDPQDDRNPKALEMTRTSNIHPMLQIEILQVALKQIEEKNAEDIKEKDKLKEILDEHNVGEMLDKLLGVIKDDPQNTTPSPTTTEPTP